MKHITLTDTQIKAYHNGATMFLFPIEDMTCEKCIWYKNKYCESSDTKVHFDSYEDCESISLFDKYLPIKKGDKDIQVRTQEYEIGLTDDEIASMGCAYSGEQHQMTYDVIGKIKECVDVKIIRVQDIEWVTGFHFPKFYNRCMEERNINRTYKDNDYVFSVEVIR